MDEPVGMNLVLGGSAGGTAMGACNAQNLLNDVFLSGRLQHLIACEMIEASGPQTSLRDYVVRREQSS